MLYDATSGEEMAYWRETENRFRFQCCTCLIKTLTI